MAKYKKAPPQALAPAPVPSNASSASAIGRPTPSAQTAEKLRSMDQERAEFALAKIQHICNGPETVQVEVRRYLNGLPALIRMNGWASDIWNPYETPLGKRNVVLIASQKFVDENPETAKLIVQAHIDATKELIKDNSAAAEAMVKILNLDPAIATEAMKNIFYTYEMGPDYNSSIEAVGDAMMEMGQITSVPDWSQFINTSFL